MKKPNPNPAPKTERRSRVAKVGIVGVAVALALSVTPLLSSTSTDALADSDHFCIQATSDGGKFVGRSKACNVEPAVSDTDQLAAKITFLIERTDVTVEAKQWAEQSIHATVTRLTKASSEVVYNETRVANQQGYSHFNVVFSADRDAEDLPFYAPSYSVQVEVGGKVYEHIIAPADFDRRDGDSRSDWTSSVALTGPDEWHTGS